MNKKVEPAKKVAEADFETLLDNYEDWVRRSTKPGAGTCNNALHEARLALINAAKIGVSTEGEEAVSKRSYRQALVRSLALESNEPVEDQQVGDFGKLLTAWLRKNSNSFSIEGGAKPPEEIAFVPRDAIERGMRLCAPMALARARAYEVTQILKDFSKKYPKVKISVGSVDLTTLPEGMNVHDLRHVLETLAEEMWLQREENRMFATARSGGRRASKAAA